MKRLIAALWILFCVGGVPAQEKPKLEIVNVSELVRIEAIPLTIDRAHRKVSFSVEVKNTGEKVVHRLFLEFKFKGEIRGYAINTSVHGEGIRTHLRPNEKKAICSVDKADLPPWWEDISSGQVTIIRIEFDDGTMWERATENKG